MDPAPRRVVIVDDDEFARALTDYLSTYPSLQVVGTARGVADLSRIAEQIGYEIAVVDIRMPDGGGAAVVEWLVDHRPDVKIIALSAFRDAAPRDEMLEKGALAFVLKGEDPSELAEVILSAD